MKTEKKSFTILGVMSGTSLDGIDLALCSFVLKDNGQIDYSIKAAETIAYSSEWLKILCNPVTDDVIAFIKIDRAYGQLLGEHCAAFIKKYDCQPDFIASHGHTFFHKPDQGYTVQIGHGATLMAAARCSVVVDFRSVDVACGGQGAPLVPIGDQLLFSQYSCCINLGGFANLSFNQGGQRLAYDICPVNMALNYLAVKLGQAYDHNGLWARAGKIDATLLKELNQLKYYTLIPPKSLGKEWFDDQVKPLIDCAQGSVQDKLHTVCVHIAEQISKTIPATKDGQVLVTGGGALNSFLIEQIQQKSAITLVVPDLLTINYKEALVFAFLGLLRVTGQVNSLSTVTGASMNTIGGSMYIYNS